MKVRFYLFLFILYFFLKTKIASQNVTNEFQRQKYTVPNETTMALTATGTGQRHATLKAEKYKCTINTCSQD